MSLDRRRRLLLLHGGGSSSSRQMPFAVSASDGISRLCRLCCTLLTCPRPGNLASSLSLCHSCSSLLLLLGRCCCCCCLGPFVLCNLSLVLLLLLLLLHVLVIVAVVVLVIIVIIAICCCRLWGRCFPSGCCRLCWCCCAAGSACKGVDGSRVEWQVASGESRVVAGKMLLLQCKPKTKAQRKWRRGRKRKKRERDILQRVFSLFSSTLKVRFS